MNYWINCDSRVKSKFESKLCFNWPFRWSFLRLSLSSVNISYLFLFKLLILILFITKPITCASNRLFANTFAIQIKPEFDCDENVNQIAEKYGFVNKGKIGNLDGHYLLEHKRLAKRSLDYSHYHHSQLKEDPKIVWVEQQEIKKRVKRDLLDYTLSDPLFKDQWYLNKGGNGGYDMNVVAAWKKGYTGKGVVVTILDDGIQSDHPDLSLNYDPEASYDLNSNDKDPTPQNNGDNKHGTRCAGEVAATAGNDICGIGIAFNSSIGGVRMLDGDVTDEIEGRALSLNRDHIDIYSASWGPEDNGKTVDGPGRLAKRAFIDGIRKGRNGKGSIFIWASGNGGRKDDNCNCDGYTNSIYTLSISSATQSGTKPWYLEECSSTLATTYSSGSIGKDRNIVTVDMDTSYFESIKLGRKPDLSRLCTKSHTGTSASAPIAAAIAALALEANPHLTWRDMQYIVLMTSRYEPLKQESGWISNGVGRFVSHKFGYGLIDAEKMVKLASKWQPLPPQKVCETNQQIGKELTIPFEVKSQLEISLNTTGCAGTTNEIKFLEHVQARISLKFKPRGNVRISLISPSGTISHLLSPRIKDVDEDSFVQWPFLSVHFWGENPIGEWKLVIKNEGLSYVPGNLSSWGMSFYGINERLPDYRDPLISKTLPSLTISDRNKVSIRLPNICASINLLKDPKTNLCIDYCPDGYFADYQLASCRKCYPYCKTCYDESSQSCLSCKKNLYYFNDGCHAQCPDSYFPDKRLQECLPCPSNCETCDNLYKCKRCSSKYTLDPITQRCTLICKTNDSNCNHCPKGCSTCSPNDINYCTSCQAGYRLSKGVCNIKKCPEFYFQQIVNRKVECRKCHPTCQSCNGPSHTQCTSCFPQNFLHSSVCNPCPIGKYMNLLNHTCDNCHKSCKACNGPESTDCTKCTSPFFLQSNRCLSCCFKNALESPEPCCRCDNPAGPCVTTEKPRSIISSSQSIYLIKSVTKSGHMLKTLTETSTTVIIGICLSSIVLFLVFFATFRLISLKGWSKSRATDYTEYQKISNNVAYNPSLEEISLTLNEIDEDEDSLYEKA